MDHGSLASLPISVTSTAYTGTFTNAKPLMTGQRKLVVICYSSSSEYYGPTYSSTFVVSDSSTPYTGTVSGSTTTLSQGTSYTFTVQLYNQYNIPYTTATSIQMNLYGSSTGLLGGTTTASTDSLGYVSFSLSVKGSAGSYYLYPVISGTTILVRALTLTLSAATAATSLKISDPGPVLIGSPFSVKVTTYIGNYGSYTTSTSITMSLSSGSFDASSTVTSSTSSGSVTFSNLILSTSMSAGTYTLTATDSGGATATLDIEASFNSQVVISMSSEPYFLKTVGTYTYYVYLSTKPSGTVSISIASIAKHIEF